MANMNFIEGSATRNTEIVEFIELEKEVVQIVMKDEENHNSLSSEMMAQLYKCFQIVKQSLIYKVVILAGTSKYFSTGGNREQLMSIFKGESKFTDGLDILTLALDCPLPVIAAMEGHALGGGLALALYSDFLVLSRESFYASNFMKYGFTPGVGITLILPHKLGAELGREMMFTARNYSGGELAQRGVPFPVVSKKEVLGYAQKMAREMAEKPRLSLLTLKEHLTSEIREKLPTVVEKELEMHDVTFHQSEVASKIEKAFEETTITSSNAQNLSRVVVRQEVRENPLNCQLDQDHIIQQEEILNQLQSGDISIENAEQLLLGLAGEKVQASAITKQMNNDQNKLMNPDNPEEILSLLSAGKISLENAENFLLEEVEPEPPRETSGLTPVQNDIETTDIAIIGISCRYPGAKNWKEFWENLKNGVDSVTEVPPGRWEEQNWYHPDPDHPGTSYSKSAGFLDEIEKFDPLFFQIPPGEAQFIEPQQRIFLEEAYHAIEDAGYAADSLKGKQCGVFVGATADSDYSKLLSISGLGTHRLALTGNLLSIVPARIAYVLDLRGPVVAVDTACSSSLVAIHQACESIQL